MVAGDYCKIGIAQNVEKRVKGVQTGCPLQVTLVHTTELLPREIASWIEKTTHYRLKQHKTLGEWFRITPQQAVTAIQQVRVWE